MPPTLHHYLKRGLDFDASPIDPNDLVEDPPEHDDEQSQAAKRRRVEAIALQYLRGRPPLILTARLKGPFTKEWKNPWAKDVKPRPDTVSKDTSNHAEGQGGTTLEASHVPSPEASRAVGRGEEDWCSQPELEPLPATAPIPDDEDLSGATEFFSVDTAHFIANNSPTNPFWLRRPASSITFPPNSQTDKSPSRQRRKGHSPGSRKSLHLAPPKELLGGRPLPIRATPPDELYSSASAPMDISSPAEPSTTVKCAEGKQNSPQSTLLTDVPASSRLREDSVQEEEARSSQAAQCAQKAVADRTPNLLKNSTTTSSTAQLVHPPCAQSFDSLVPATTYKSTSTVQVPQSSPIRPSKEDIRRSAEQLIDLTPRSTTKNQSSSTRLQTAKDIGLPKKLRHDLVTSPVPASSTGFMYRRVGQPRGEVNNTSKAKPTAVSFSSSPTLKKAQEADLPTVVSEVTVSVVEAEAIGEVATNESTEAAKGHHNQELDGQSEIFEKERHRNGQDEEQESYKSKQSQYSTQAAMLLAQLEFQDDSSQSSMSSATLRPWSQPAQNTPPPPLLQPSPAITPLSVFNPRINNSFEDLAGDSTLHDPLISTQDLFNAASPFAFSTVKKKSQRTRRTSLRFALTSRLTENINAKSPTPSAERVPLKHKNTPTVWSFTLEKSSMGSPKLTSQSPKRTTNDVELPQLDFHTSLDFGPNADFTDYFLKGLNNEP